MATAAASKKSVRINGCVAAAQAAKYADVDVITAYPIRPYTATMMALAQMVANGELDAEYIVADSEHFTVNGNRFSATLDNPFGTSADGFPTDAEVRVSCGLASGSRPFHGSNIPTGSSPSIFTSLGATPCGQAYVPAGTDGRIPCPFNIKGFNGNGGLSTTNFWPEITLRPGPSVAAGDVTGEGASGAGLTTTQAALFRPSP